MTKKKYTFCCATSFCTTAMEAGSHCPSGLTKTFIDRFDGIGDLSFFFVNLHLQKLRWFVEFRHNK